MKIGNLPTTQTALTINKWYFEFEFSSRPPYMLRVFKPFISVCVVKILDYGNLDYQGYDKGKRKGGRKTWVFPYGIEINIIK